MVTFLIKTVQKVEKQAGIEGAFFIIALLRCLFSNRLLPFYPSRVDARESEAGSGNQQH